MKKVAAIFVLLALVLLTAGCTGGGGTASETTATTDATAVANATGTPAPVAGAEPEERTVPRPININRQTPSFFSEALKKNKPVFVFFYDDDDVSRVVINEVRQIHQDKAHQNSVIFMLLKMGDKAEYAALASELDVNFIPYVGIVNARRQIVFEHNGYVDAKVLEQALYNAKNK